MRSLKSVVAKVPVNAELFIGCNIGEYCISYVDTEKGFVNLPIYDERFIEWLEIHNKSLVKQDSKNIRKIIDELVDITIENSMGKEIVSRMAYDHDKIFYNFWNGKVMVVEPGKNSIVDFKSLKDKYFAFYDSGMMSEQVMPKQGKKMNLPEKIGLLFGLDSHNNKLLTIMLVAMFVPQILKPILHLKCANTTTQAVCNYVIQALVDPIKEDGVCYRGSVSDEWLFAKRYLLIANDFKDIKDEVEINVENITPCGSVMYNLRNSFVVNNICLESIHLEVAPMIVTVEPNLNVGISSLDKAKRIMEAASPFLLNEIFKTLSVVMEVKGSIVKEDFGELTEFVQWGRAIAKVLFGNEEDFDGVFSTNKPLDRSMTDCMLFGEFNDNELEAC